MASLIEKLRIELSEINEKILNHPSLKELSREVLEKFIYNQLYIIPHDLRSLSIMLSRCRDKLELDFFKILVNGDYNAYNEILKLAEELNISFDYSKLNPKAISYTHFLSWLALNGTPGDSAVALVVNIPVWGENVRKLGENARKIGIKSTKFFELFSGPFNEIEDIAEKIAERYCDWGRYLFIAKTIQKYELDFWDSLIE
ncbi:MAG: TenA family transcriptional regulator [Aigarchaeota archaeon]|nr:TenA family transcriptional regulator [Candidatus Geocrenenecus dongiae]